MHVLGYNYVRNKVCHMPRFLQKRSHKVSTCRRLAKQIAEAAAFMGIATFINKSSISASHYVYASKKEIDSTNNEVVIKTIKIRCSDHKDRHNGSDWSTGHADCPSKTIVRMAEHFNCEIPDYYTPESYATRSDISKRAAQKRECTRQATETNMVTNIIKSLKKEKVISAIKAGKIIDIMYSDVPRAQRQRMACKSSQEAVKQRHLETANGDVVALTNLTYKYNEAKSMLFTLVGAEQFKRLRPLGYPRPCWTPDGHRLPRMVSKTDGLACYM
jgi:hypothetical protein